jgi:Flp pilus assembly protein TadG
MFRKMSSLRAHIFRRLARENRGAEIAEAAAVLPLTFMIILGIFWFGQAFSIYGTITRAAQDGARAGAAQQCTTCTTGNTPAQNANSAVLAALAAAKLDSTRARYPVAPPTVYACNGGGSVTCDGSVSNICVQTGIQLSNTTSGGAGVCGIAVSFQYPFQFWLPFTSLNKQQIWITASARARLETQ